MIGRLVKDIEIKPLNTGRIVGRSSIASNSPYRKQDGTWEDNTCFIDITIFDDLAERIKNRCNKGAKLLIEGRLNYDKYEDQYGNKKTKHSIIVQNFEPLDKREQGENQGYNSGYDSGGSYGNSYGNSGYSSRSYGSNSNANYGGNSQYGGGGYGKNQGYQGGYGQGGANSNAANNSGKNANEIPDIDVEEDMPF